jgi:hypothetical protein
MSNPEQVELRARLKPVLEAEKWIGVYPDGFGVTGGFNGAGCCAGSTGNDVAFSEAIFSYLQPRYFICDHTWTCMST